MNTTAVRKYNISGVVDRNPDHSTERHHRTTFVCDRHRAARRTKSERLGGGGGGGR